VIIRTIIRRIIQRIVVYIHFTRFVHVSSLIFFAILQLKYFDGTLILFEENIVMTLFY